MRNIMKITIKTPFVLILSSFIAVSAIAGPNNTGYGEIIEIKVWPTYIDIYSAQSHVCPHEQKQRLILDKNEKEMFSIALAAMTSRMQANINYSCSANGVPKVEGIRVRPQ